MDGRRWERRLLTGCVALYVALLLFTYRDSFVFFKGDSGDYIFSAQQSLFSAGFWTRRAFVVPLVYKAAGENPLLIQLAQIGLHALCWLFFAGSLRRILRDPVVRWAGPALLLLLSLTVEINYWNLAILSESLSNSLLVLAAGCLLRASEAPGALPQTQEGGSGRALLLASAAMALWGFTRAPNAYSVLSLGVLWLSATGVPPVRRAFGPKALTAAALLCIASFGLQSALLSRSALKPWLYALNDCIFNRVLPDPAAAAWFRAAGLPMSPVVGRYTGHGNDYMKNWYAPKPDFNEIDPKYDAWVETRGFGTYVRYLTGHPLWAFRQGWALRDRMLNPQVDDANTVTVLVSQYQTTEWVKALSSRGRVNAMTDFTATLSVLLFFRSSPWVLLVTAAGVLLLLTGPTPSRWAAFFLVQLAVLALAQATIAAVTNATVEIDRHAIGFAMVTRLLFWLTLIFWCDLGAPVVRAKGAVLRRLINRASTAVR